jgi:GxxExxY protein
MTENEISKIIVGVCFNIHKLYGPGLFESVYEELVCYELGKEGLYFKRQHDVPLIHDKLRMEVAFRADVIVEDKVIIELKSVEKIADLHYKQVQTYLKLTKLKLGMLINFNVPLIKDGIHRIVNNL